MELGSGDLGSGVPPPSAPPSAPIFPTVLAYGAPAVITATFLAIALHLVGWSVSRIECVLASSSRISDKSYVRFVPLVMLLIRVAVLVPLVQLAVLCAC